MIKIKNNIKKTFFFVDSANMTCYIMLIICTILKLTVMMVIEGLEKHLFLVAIKNTKMFDKKQW